MKQDSGGRARPDPLAYVDADELARVVQRPTVQVGGRLYVGRILSYPEFLPFQRLVEGMRSGEVKVQGEDVVTMFRRYGDTVFGRRWWQLWRIGRNPTRHLLRLPPVAMLETFQRLFRVQARATTGGAPENLTSTNASPEPASGEPSAAATSPLPAS